MERRKSILATNEEKSKRKIELLADDYTLFPNIAKEWLNWKKNQVNH